MMFSQCVHLSGTRVHDNLLSVGIHSDPMGRSIGPASCMYLAKHQQRADSVFPRVPLMSSRRILVPEVFTLTLQGFLATATVHTLQYLYLSCLDVLSDVIVDPGVTRNRLPIRTEKRKV